MFSQDNALACPSYRQLSDRRQTSNKHALIISTLWLNIVLYSENHPHDTLLILYINLDKNSNLDVLLIMGTSLKVVGVQNMMKDFAKAVH